MKSNGRCLCGAVVFSIRTKSKVFDACHCSMCRRWGGGPALTVEVEGQIDFKSEEFVKIYSSSEWAERGFCSQCGTNLFYQLKDGRLVSVALGLLEDQSDYRFTKQIYIDHRPKCYSFANETEMMTEDDVLKAYGVLS